MPPDLPLLLCGCSHVSLHLKHLLPPMYSSTIMLTKNSTLIQACRLATAKFFNVSLNNTVVANVSLYPGVWMVALSDLEPSHRPIKFKHFMIAYSKENNTVETRMNREYMV